MDGYDTFHVVANDAGQYSIWPVTLAVPAGWRTVGVSGSKEQCLDHVARVWPDVLACDGGTSGA
jgi:MbtH protein